VLSIVVPTLQAETTLRTTLTSCVDTSLESEVIVVDGGSSDSTLSIARDLGVTVVECSPGRGIQLAVGAETATGEWLLFLHADSIPTVGWDKHVGHFMAERSNRFRAAVFDLRLDDGNPQARRLEWLVRWRTRLFALPYGDQGLLINRAFYDGLGGYRPIPVMEDVDLIRRIGRAYLRVLNSHITTSAIKYQQGGYWKRPIRNLGLMCLYRLGVPPSKLAEMYK
jgi:rSAM/selenodomain-associated transferase 2